MKPIEQMQTPDPRNVEHWRADFPILGERVHGQPLVYLDNGATTQKPAAVIYAENAYYRHSNANVHRGVHLLSQRATDSFEAARAKIARFINAQRPEEIVFVRGTTEAINLVAQSYARPQIKPGDEILISAMEHHSNIVPWQLVCEQTGAALKVVPIDDTGALDADAYERLFSERTRLVAMTHLANALGSINPVERIVAGAHARGVPVLLDGAQAIAHLPVDVRAIDCDFYAFSGHKVYGPTGIGVLYARAALLEAMPPWQGGGDMIRSVTFEKTEYNEIPWKFEAGTPNIAGAIALGAALDYVDSIGMEAIAAHENELLAYATDELRVIPGLRFIGSARDKASILSFVLDGVHAHDVGTILDHHGIAVRAGHHCAMPVMQRFGVPATVRASLALYNTHQDIDALVEGLGRVRELFGT
ncbi:SufS family cysteine desulfurase [Paraburkholderia sp. CNPSo 3155]|uniref:SufS family cysteine desulfurase n=1 Tax=Paraburkholderia atlantica TaxID=2654982 RepID=UPI00128DEC3C|nr:cysteine desulfurase [Paraburkholderia atlantica]MPW08713.1 SufS family cysteine desulfurase [Paraburkholderia atlantica]